MECPYKDSLTHEQLNTQQKEIHDALNKILKVFAWDSQKVFILLKRLQLY